MRGEIAGRARELDAITALLDGVGGGPSVLALWGDAGVGKTTLWEAGVAAAHARGHAVLACRAAAAEARLTYAGLADLFATVGPRAGPVACLPGAQRRALDAALLRSSGEEDPPDPRAVAAAFLSVLDATAAAGPVVVAVDDVQWLDGPTRRVVAFAVRRCSGPVATLTAGRDRGLASRRDEIRPRDPARLTHVEVGPLSLGALHHVLVHNLGRSFPRPVLLRIAETSGGNPLYALEIARSLDACSAGSSPAGFPDSLRAVVQDRLRGVTWREREALLVVSALASPRLDLVGRACGADPVELLGRAEDAGVVELSGGYARFTHPLLANGVYGEASPSRRRALHRTLSRLVDDVEERAAHLARAATGPEPEAIAALDAAAAAARRRGAASAAAELVDLAIGLGADDPCRRAAAARDCFHADDPLRARQHLAVAIPRLRPGPERAEALGLLGAVLVEVDDHARAIESLELAFTDAGTDPALRASIAVELAMALPDGGRVEDALPYAAVARDEAERAGDDGLLAEALGCSVVVGLLAGRGVDHGLLARALALEDPGRRSHAVRWPSLHAALVHLWAHRAQEARAALVALRRRCLDRGEESDLWFVSFHAATVALWSGDVAAAEALTADMTERALMVGTEHRRAFALAAQAHLAAWVGRVDEARTAARRACGMLAEAGMASGSLFAVGVLGMLELSVGDPEAAARWLRPAAAAAVEMGLVEPACAPFLPDAAEALVALGRLDEAEQVVVRLEAGGAGTDRAWAAAVGARSRGLLAAARGDVGAARAALERALDAHDRLPLRYDRGRTLLGLGQVQRRCNERRAAGASFEEAARCFEAVGAARWAGNARVGLRQLGVRGAGAASCELTPTEEHVAELAGRGLTNREVAAALLISPKTVEANLTRAYRKLGIRSRAQLGGWLAARHGEGAASDA